MLILKYNETAINYFLPFFSSLTAFLFTAAFAVLRKCFRTIKRRLNQKWKDKRLEIKKIWKKNVYNF